MRHCCSKIAKAACQGIEGTFCGLIERFQEREQLLHKPFMKPTAGCTGKALGLLTDVPAKLKFGLSHFYDLNRMLCDRQCCRAAHLKDPYRPLLDVHCHACLHCDKIAVAVLRRQVALTHKRSEQYYWVNFYGCDNTLNGTVKTPRELAYVIPSWAQVLPVIIIISIAISALALHARNQDWASLFL